LLSLFNGKSRAVDCGKSADSGAFAAINPRQAAAIRQKRLFLIKNLQISLKSFILAGEHPPYCQNPRCFCRFMGLALSSCFLLYP